MVDGFGVCIVVVVIVVGGNLVKDDGAMCFQGHVCFSVRGGGGGCGGGGDGDGGGGDGDGGCMWW